MRLSQVVIFGLAVAVAGCAGSESGIRILSSNGEGPDEFRIVPSKPLSAPENYAELPAPTPGGENLTDVDPVGDAVAALGGRRSATQAGAPSSADAAMVNYAARKGRQADIRAVTAAEDEDFRARRGRFANIRIVPTDRYNEIYDEQHLDQYREQRRWQLGGARTPAAPPKN